MHLIITCKCEKDRMKKKLKNVATWIFRRSRAGNCDPGSDLAEF